VGKIKNLLMLREMIPLHRAKAEFEVTISIILYRVGGTCRVYRLHHSICLHSFIADSTRRRYNHSFTLDSDPLMSCVRAVFGCPHASKAGR
jgi:hypothetical protein